MPVIAEPSIYEDVKGKVGDGLLASQGTPDGIPTFWIAKENVHDLLRYLKHEIPRPFRMLYDLTAIDERPRKYREAQPESDFTVVYHLLSFDRNQYVRIKVPLKGEHPNPDSITDIWPAANWYEREVWDMFGVRFRGHPHLVRILMPKTWTGHPLRKDHPARATEMGPFHLPEEKAEAEQEALRFRPEEWGMKRAHEDTDFLFLNVGPQHPGTEKMGERQSWHTYIPYTDRVDYLGGVMNNLAYLTALEKLAGVEVPPRGQVIRVMMAELFRIISHLVWYGTFAQDVGQMSPVFFTFNDRERAFTIVEAITGARMHPSWFRIGGVAADLPKGWEKMFRDFIKYLPPRLVEYDRTVMKNLIFRARTKGIGSFTTEEAIDWGVTGPNLRATGFAWDFRKKQPYSGYDQFEFDIPTGRKGDCYDRALVRVEEMRQSLRIIEQCLRKMPDGPYKSADPLATPPIKDRTMHDIETLITHFLSVSWGPVVPPGEALGAIEATKGNNGYYLVSDGSTVSYRTRIRTPSFPHIQMLPLISRGLMVPDLIAILGVMDFVLADIDR